MGRRNVLLSALAALCLALFMQAVCYASPEAIGEAALCLDCHGKRGIVKKFANSESVEAYVEPSGFRNSVHGGGCSGCHPEFSAQEHPTRTFRSKWQYRVRSARVCRNCHTEEKLRETSVHANLLKGEREGGSPVCTDCHGAHAIKAVAGGKVFASEEQYCMKCHGREMKMPFRDGDSLSLKIDQPGLKASVHGSLCCSDCHFGFSSEEHPKRNFRSRRDYSLASSEICRRCHFDKYTKTLESIHFTILSQGNLAAPVCTDCHGAHRIAQVSADRTASAAKCRKCHQDIYDIYAGSVHGSALLSAANCDVPVCISCHRAHDISDPLTTEYHERIPEMCGNCHANKEVMDKYGLSTEVLNTYLSDFHGATLKIYRQEKGSLLRPARPIAVCNDCHGTHNIARTIGPDAATVKANLLKRCQKCHRDAPENFPDAWLSHYVPSMKTAPLVFIVNTIYKIFLPVMVIGLILQIMLHVWRYIVDR